MRSLHVQSLGGRRLERDRLTRALELREMVNEHHLPPDLPRIATRTISALLLELDVSSENAASA